MSDHILQFWNLQADKFGTSHSASWGDKYAIDLEIQTIGRWIKEGDKVLDVGCANGYSAIHHLDRNISSITGVDSSKGMIREAQKTQAKCGSLEKLFFEVGDVRKLRFENDTFDVVYTTRTLINLPTWDEQKQGISECIRVCKVGGTIIFSEAFWEPLVLLNSLRSLKSLTPLVEPDFNRYLKKKCLEEYFLSEGIQFEIEDFSSIYFLGTRFLRELVTNPEDDHGYSGPINTIFYNIEKDYSGGGFGIQQAYVIQKSK
jgi:ubiquinone/menaquinone biosynthesis C-methylase UbiE